MGTIIGSICIVVGLGLAIYIIRKCLPLQKVNKDSLT